MKKLMKWREMAARLRMDVIEMSHRAKTAHLASSLSCIDILTVLYSSILKKINPKDSNYDERDRFILSKGHAATALYATLAFFDIIDRGELLGYGQRGSTLEEHPSPKLTGVEAATGSLGHGLPVGSGMALAAKISSKTYNVYVLMSDGECNEGSVWEAAMFASQHKLDNLIAIVDFNKWQATGRSRDILRIEPLVDKWESFGWDVLRVDGHSHQQLFEALNKNSVNQPRMIIADTIKGKGVSFMEDDNNWHYRSPDASEVSAAKEELGVL